MIYFRIREKEEKSNNIFGRMCLSVFHQVILPFFLIIKYKRDQAQESIHILYKLINLILNDDFLSCFIFLSPKRPSIYCVLRQLTASGHKLKAHGPRWFGLHPFDFLDPSYNGNIIFCPLKLILVYALDIILSFDNLTNFN